MSDAEEDCRHLDGLFQLQPSILDDVSKLCSENEAEELCRIVGHSLVEQARDLLEEAKSLLEIWTDLKEDTDKVKLGPALCLPEPPMARERLVQEVRLLASHLPGHMAHSHRSLGSVVTDEESKQVLHYALGYTHREPERCRSGCGLSQYSSPVEESTPMRHSSAYHREGSLGISHLAPSLDNPAAVVFLREAVKKEVAQRKEEVAFLQSCAERESGLPHSKPPPSLRQLRQLGSELERRLLSGAALPSQPAGRTILPRPPVGNCPDYTAVNFKRASRIQSPTAASPLP